MANLIATSVLRGNSPGESHGGVYLINLESNRILKPVDWNALDTGRQGGSGERGLRGIVCHGERIYIAASDELLVFDQAFNAVASFRNAYLEDCRDICVFERHLFVTSAGYDAILGFNLEAEKFDWALRVVTDGRVFGARRFDPNGDEGPLLINKLGLDSVHCEPGGMYVSGTRTGALLRFSGTRAGVRATLPQGAHDARPYQDGILFNDTNAGAVRLERPDSRMAFPLPRFPSRQATDVSPGLAPERHAADAKGITEPPSGSRRSLHVSGAPSRSRAEGACHASPDNAHAAQPAFGRGLCVISEREIAAGSSPATISIYDLDAGQATKAVNLSPDPRQAIHGIAVWPYPWPDR